MLKLIFVFTSLLLVIPCQAKTIYVDANAPGVNNGQDWTNAYKYLQDALADAGSATKPVEIRVAQGIHKPDQSLAYPPLSGNRAATFQLINGVSLKGGYAGFDEPDPNERDIKLYETTLSGDLDGNDVKVNDPCDLLKEPTRAENSYHVVTGSGTKQNAVLDGFTITGGNSNEDYTSTHSHGGGMLNEFCDPMVINCTFMGNYARTGAGMCNRSNSPTMINCIFIGNSADYGGGIYNFGSIPTIKNCTFTCNSALYGAGIYNTYLSNLLVTGCTFISNSAENEGGGIYNYSYSHPIITNCIFWFDTPDEICNYKNCSSDVTYSNIQGGWPGLGNIDVDPCFADANNGDYHLKSQAGRWDPNSQSWIKDNVTSPCIDAANPGCPVDDEPIPNGNRRNMGAYGGTVEASKSPTYWRSIADMTNDWVVDSYDLRVYVDYWLESGECIPSDFDRSQFVDFNDFAIFGLHWSHPSASEPGISYRVEDCNMEGGQNQSPTEDSNDTRFSVWIEGRYIHFKDLITANCCADEIELRMMVEDGLITIYEIEHLTTPCFCICDYPTTATLGPFEPGIYLLEVIDIDGKSLGIVEVIIGGSPEPGITYQIKDCNRDASDVFAAEPPDPTRFKVTIEGPYIHFEDMMTANCCPDKLELEMTVEDNLITIYETEYTSEGCRCICSFPITATLGPFENATYTLEVYETMGGFIGSTTITISPGE